MSKLLNENDIKLKRQLLLEYVRQNNLFLTCKPEQLPERLDQIKNVSRIIDDYIADNIDKF